MEKNHKVWQSHIPGCALGAKVVNTRSEDKNGNTTFVPDIAFALRFWKKSLKDSGKIEELKSRTRYIKKSQKRRVQKQHAVFMQKCDDENNE